MITGCSTGIGLASAVMLKERGWDVYATARRADDLKMLADFDLHPVEIDLADSTSVRGAASGVLESTGGELGALVNNAGFGQAGAVEDLTREALRAQFEVNVFGLQELTAAVVPAFIRRGSGRIVNISSVLGNVSLPFLGAYCSSKFAVEALSDSLRVELFRTGVAVSVIQPGPIITAFRENALDQVDSNVDAANSRFGKLFAREMERRRTRVKTPGFINKPPEAVGRKVVHALHSAWPHRRYCVTLPAYAGALLRRVAPFALLDALLTKRVARLLEKT